MWLTEQSPTYLWVCFRKVLPSKTLSVGFYPDSQLKYITLTCGTVHLLCQVNLIMDGYLLFRCTFTDQSVKERHCHCVLLLHFMIVFCSVLFKVWLSWLAYSDISAKWAPRCSSNSSSQACAQSIDCVWLLLSAQNQTQSQSKHSFSWYTQLLMKSLHWSIKKKQMKSWYTGDPLKVF